MRAGAPIEIRTEYFSNTNRKLLSLANVGSVKRELNTIQNQC
jgi:hypothetical protein